MSERLFFRWKYKVHPQTGQHVKVGIEKKWKTAQPKGIWYMIPRSNEDLFEELFDWTGSIMGRAQQMFDEKNSNKK